MPKSIENIMYSREFTGFVKISKNHISNANCVLINCITGVKKNMPNDDIIAIRNLLLKA
jgi:hypothetical protein